MAQGEYAVSVNEALVVWLGGLRGAVGLALALLVQSTPGIDKELRSQVRLVLVHTNALHQLYLTLPHTCSPHQTWLHNAAQISFQVAGIVLLTLLINGMLAPIVFPRLLPKRDLYVSPELVINALKVWAATTPSTSSTLALLTPIATATHSTRMRRRTTTCITCVAPSPASSTSTGALCAT